MGLFQRKRKVEEKPVSVAEAIPSGAKILAKNPSGFVVSLDGRIDVVPLKRHEIWGDFAPVFEAREVEEVWLFPGRTVMTVRGVGRVSIIGRPRPEELEEIIVRIIANTGVKVDMRRPRGTVDIGDWRVALQIEAGGQMNVVATRVANVPRITEILPTEAAAALILLLLRPSVVVILGPPGSGKTTLLNSLLREVATIYPNLHVSVVEKYRELVFREGWFSWIVSESLVDGVRFSMRYYRPDLLVVGEMMAEDVWSIVEPGRAGLPVITTFHSPSARRAVKVLSDALRVHLGYGSETAALQYVDVFVEMKKVLTPTGVERGVDSIYLSDGQNLVPVFAQGRLAGDVLEKAMPPRIYVGNFEEAFLEVASKLGGALQLAKPKP